MAYLDIFGKDASSIKKKKLFLLDMDGTIYQEDDIFDGTLPMIGAIMEAGAKYLFITNNSSKSVKSYVHKVHAMDIEATEDTFFTSSQATAMYIKNNYPGRKVYCQGTLSLINEFKNSGIDITEDIEGDIGVCVVGFDTEITGAKIRKTSEVLTRFKNIPYIATNPDYRCPVSFGYIPDCGSMCIGLEYATGRKPVFIGKPEPTMINIAMEKHGVTREETLVIGDRLYTDIASGINAGVDTVCVLTGEATLDDINASEYKPTYVLDSVMDIYQILNSY
ncbi:MAG: HAD-IIA family hydrolase [Lachnospiraceae bacterium]|nr:HAD-IIA family hydrolase [Lachnospiraceae bacterium]